MSTSKVKIVSTDQAYNVLNQAPNTTFKLQGGKSKNTPSLILEFTSALRSVQSDGSGTTGFAQIVDGVKNKNGDITFSFEGGRTVIVGKKLFGFAQRLFTTTPATGQLFEVGSVWTAYAQANSPGPTPPTPPTPVNQTFTLTTGQDFYQGGAGNDTFNGNQTTFTGLDTIDGAAGTNTLNLTDNGTAAWTLPAALVSNVQKVSLRNVNGTGAVAGVTEVTTFQFKDLGIGQTVVIAGITFTAGSSGATAAEVAGAFTSASITTSSSTAAVTVGGGTITGPTFVTSGTAAAARTVINTTLATAGYTTALGTAVVNSVVFTSNAAPTANVIDLVATGTAVTGRSQVVTMSITTEASAAMAITINGISVPAANGSGVDGDATSLANAINAYLGFTAATTATGVITVTTPTLVNFGTATGTALVVANVLTQGFLPPAAPTISIVQGVAPVSATTYTDIINAANFIGSQEFISNQSTGAVNVFNLTTQSLTKQAGSGDLTANYAATATAATMNINGGSTAGAVTVGTTETALISATVASTGAANTIGALNLGDKVASLTVNAATNLTTSGITGAGLKTATFSGLATNVDVGLIPATATTVNASGLTAGGVKATLNTGAPADFAFTGGGGKDTLTVTNAFTNTVGAISGGGGTSDTIVALTNVITAATGALLSNFEVLQNKVAASQDASVVSGITSVITSVNGGGFTKLTAAQAANVVVDVSQAAGTTYALATDIGLADVLGLALTGSTSSTVVNAAALTVSGFETINLSANTGGIVVRDLTAGTDYGDIAFAAASTVKTINLSGSKSAQVDISSNATAVTVLNGSTATAPISFKTGGQTGALVVTGSANNDDFTVGAVGTNGTIALTTGTGNDKITVAAGALKTAVTIAGGDGTDSLTNTLDSGQNVGILNMTGVETFNVILVGGTANAIDFRNVTGLNTITLDGAAGDDIALTRLNAATVINFKDTTGIVATTLQTGSTQAVRYVGASSGDIESLDLDSATTALTITSENTSAAVTATFTAITGTGLKSITINGSDAVTLVSSAVPASVTLFDATAATAKFTYSTGTASATSAIFRGSTVGDVITAGAGNDTIQGNKGNDTITGGTGNDTYIFSATGANNGLDVITGTAGSGSGFDLWNFAAFMPGGTVDQNGGTGTAIVAFPATATASVNITNKLALYADEDVAGVDTATEIAALFGSGKPFSLAAGGKTILYTGAIANADDIARGWFIDNSLDGSSTVTASDIVNVVTQGATGSTTGFDIDTFVTTNFVF